MDTIKKKFGEQLKTIRNMKGFTQEILAEKIGINIRQLARIEAGESFIKSDTLYRICVVLNITPGVLFNFGIEDELSLASNGEYLHFNVMKNANIVKLVTQNEINSQINTDDINDFDTKMLAMAQKLQKDIFIDELQDGVVICTKTYTPKGEVRLQDKMESNNSFEQLKENLLKIANDEKKLEYMNLAFNSLYSSKALEQFQFLIKGLELR